MPEPLEIRLLGPFEVLADGAPADVGGSKRQALLAMLALRRGHVVAVDAIVDGLWGVELPAAPRNALHHHVARLRAALGEDAIAGSPDGYALREARVDAAEFEELLMETRAALRDGDVAAAADAVAAGLALWRGTALQGLTGTPWLDAEARRLESLRVDALEEEFEVRLALGEHCELTAPLRSALTDNPFRERLWGQLMLALYRSGRQADALDTFQEARRVLADQLGLEPGPDLRRLQEAILAHDPAIAAVPVDRRRRGNLPAPSRSFLGRDVELREVAALLQEHRFVLLTGPPGVGKTRLAVETARSLERDFPDGIWLVELSGAHSSAAVQLLANVLDVRGSDPLARVAARLHGARALLVIDACEHVLGETVGIVSTLLDACPGVCVLATSREAPEVPSGARFPVAPLGAAAVDLFLARARAARPGFEADDAAVALVADIARRLDGLPLAVELAAARMNVFGLTELASILERREALHDAHASDPSRTALRELVEWSYDLLHADEKALLQLLAVHRGGASLASLCATAASWGLGEPTVAYLLAALADKSVVFASFARGETRYDMLDTVRDYVIEGLAESGGLADVRHAHAECFAAMADSAHLELRSGGWLSAQDRLRLENENFWAALEYARDTCDPGIAARLGTLGWYFALTERVSEGRRFLELALAATSDESPAELRVELEAVLCYLAAEELDVEAAVATGRRALERAGGADMPRQLGLAQLAFALAVAQSGQTDRADALAREALATLESAGDHWGSAAAGIIRATAAASAGNVATAAEMARAIGRHADAIDYDAFRVPGLLIEAWVAERRDDTAAAVEAYRRALEVSGRIGFGDHAAFALSGLGAIAFAGGDPREAEELQRQALATAEAAHATWAAAYAQLQLARIATADGDTARAAELYRGVLEWSQTERPHEARESLVRALAGNPASAAELGLAELGENALI